MALRLRRSVVRGEIDNRVKGRVTGKVWLVGREEPVMLTLEGNGYRDVAGSLFVFRNPHPREVDDECVDLYSEQVGTIGDYTASRKVCAYDIPLDEALAKIRQGEKPAEHMANSLYLEWFSQRNGRVVIESCDYEMKVVDTAWVLDEQGESDQREKNAESLAGFMQKLGAAIEQSREPLCDPGEDQPMDEFSWERLMKESDARTDKYGALLEKYMDHPDRDQIIAREMGWDEPADDLKDYDLPDFDDPDCAASIPNPLTEGTDWIMGRHGRPVHPLQKLASDTVMELWCECRDVGLLTEGAGNDDLHEMLFYGQCIGSKLAGALNSLAYDRINDNGFIVACLKRALPYFDDLFQALEAVRERALLPDERLSRFSNDMFAIRAGIIQLMERYRNQFGR